MDYQTALWLVENFKRPLVKVQSASRGGYCTYGRAQLLSANEAKGTAIIQPFGHKRTEEVQLEDLVKWNSRYTDEALKPEKRKSLSDPLSVQISQLFRPPEIEEQKVIGPVKEEEVVKTKTKRKHEEVIAEINKLREMGKTIEEMGIILGLSHATLGYHIAKHKQANQKPVTKAEVKTVEKIIEVPVVKEVVIQADKLDKIMAGIRGILSLPIPDANKLLMIEAMIA
jgi:hypothetical protein